MLGRCSGAGPARARATTRVPALRPTWRRRSPSQARDRMPDPGGISSTRVAASAVVAPRPEPPEEHGRSRRRPEHRRKREHQQLETDWHPSHRLSRDCGQQLQPCTAPRFLDTGFGCDLGLPAILVFVLLETIRRVATVFLGGAAALSHRRRRVAEHLRAAREDRGLGTSRLRMSDEGRIAQRESARFTRERSLVRSQVRPSRRGRVRSGLAAHSVLSSDDTETRRGKAWQG